MPSQEQLEQMMRDRARTAGPELHPDDLELENAQREEIRLRVALRKNNPAFAGEHRATLSETISALIAANDALEEQVNDLRAIVERHNATFNELRAGISTLAIKAPLGAIALRDTIDKALRG